MDGKSIKLGSLVKVDFYNELTESYDTFNGKIAGISEEHWGVVYYAVLPDKLLSSELTSDLRIGKDFPICGIRYKLTDEVPEDSREYYVALEGSITLRGNQRIPKKYI